MAWSQIRRLGAHADYTTRVAVVYELKK